MGVVFRRSDSQYFTIPHNSRFEVSQFTVSAWIKPRSNANKQRILSRASSASSGNEIFGLDIYKGNCRLIMGKMRWGGLLGLFPVYSTDDCVGGDVTMNEWSFVAGTFDGIAMRVYVDGILTATVARPVSTDALLTGSIPMSIGADYQSATSVSEFFDGEMEDVKLYNRALSANEILTQYTTKGSANSTSNLIFNMGFYEGSKSTQMIPKSILKDVGPFGYTTTYSGKTDIWYGECVTRTRRGV